MSSFSKLVLILYFASRVTAQSRSSGIKFTSMQQAAQMERVLSSCTCRTATASVVEVEGGLLFKV